MELHSLITNKSSYSSQIFYIFSQNAYDFINNEFLFFEKLEKGSEGDFLIENQIPVH